MEVIVLAGGLGTRLRAVVQNIPKPMAPVKNRPFLEYLLKWLCKYPISKIVLSTGYKSEVIEEYFGNCFNSIPVEYARETEPLGTGGGIFNALKYTKSNDVLIVNGDTYFPVNIEMFINEHLTKRANISIALKQMFNFDRYGSVSINTYGDILQFHEKKPQKVGLINGGIYVLNKDFLKSYHLPTKFSFEGEILEKGLKRSIIKGFVFDEVFLDIGIPEDYYKASKIL